MLLVMAKLHSCIDRHLYITSPTEVNIVHQTTAKGIESLLKHALNVGIVEFARAKLDHKRLIGEKIEVKVGQSVPVH